MVFPTCFGITLPSSGSVSSSFWEMLNWGAVDRILWMDVLCLVTWCVHHVTMLFVIQHPVTVSIISALQEIPADFTIKTYLLITDPIRFGVLFCSAANSDSISLQSMKEWLINYELEKRWQKLILAEISCYSDRHLRRSPLTLLRISSLEELQIKVFIVFSF
jgi:hypothetical protein